ncbi:MAG: VWA domain-containing protein [Acidobacteria bacterium]|nr:VWA domain-containing protein [Acidobacteriota bacterium]
MAVVLKFARRLAAIGCLLPAALLAEVGVLIPSGAEGPDPQKLALEEMRVEARIEDQTARVRILQIYASRQPAVQEGEWVFGLPSGAAVSGFAVWDDVRRIPGVILERKRAQEIYESLKAQAIDPGLLQQGEYGPEEARRNQVFSAKVVPIPGYGFKRVEVEYHERIPVSDLRGYFALPLRPEAYQAQTAGKLSVRLELLSSHAIADFRARGRRFPLTIAERTPNRVVATFEGENVTFDEDLAVDYALAPPQQPQLTTLFYRDPTPEPPTGAWRPPGSAIPGYFQASVLLPGAAGATVTPAGEGPPAPRDDSPARDVVALFDASLSMQWEKLDRSFRALETLLLRLRPADRFNVIVFDSELRPFAPELQPGDRATVERALDFVRQGRIRGGTALEQALGAGLAQAARGSAEPYLALLSDGGATRGRIRNALLADWYAAERAKLPPSRRPRTFVFGVGDDANLPLLEALARQDGVWEHVRSSEPIDFKLTSFVGKLGRRPVENLRLETAPGGAFDLVYPLDAAAFAGSMASWVGRYLLPGREAVLRALGGSGPTAVDAEARVTPPEQAPEKEQVARAWAQARVDALLDQIDRNGEDEETIQEIIYWSKKFTFVTPYTSFLAAPRSLLRPRVIRPGDPVLRIHTDESIVSVTALFPFGLVKPLRFLDDENVWQTRFLAPKDMADGRHAVRLVLRDDQGRVFREEKTFLIASRPPTVRARLEKTQFRRGETVELKVSASRSTRTLTARMYGVPPVSLRWNEAAKANTGSLTIPPDLPAGEYELRLTAEDFAHNIGVEEVTLAVVP